MDAFHDALVRPFLRAVQARVIMEVGADQALHTELLQRWCAETDGHLHVIETDPSERLESVVDAQVTTVHVGTSHAHIPRMPALDVAIIDGDHNYWTVAEELRLLAARCDELGVGLPLMLFHDVGWPYGRRDMYYDPDRIPAVHTQPMVSNKAIPLDGADLIPPPGFGLGFPTAVTAGGPRNGVLTAVEDFAATLDGADLIVLPPMHGFGALVPAHVREAHPELPGLIAHLAADSPLAQALAVTERARLETIHQVMEEAWAKAHAMLAADTAEAALQALQADLDSLTEQDDGLTAELDALRDRVAGLEEDRERARADAAAALAGERRLAQQLADATIGRLARPTWPGQSRRR